jgi:HAMP domain-containing protein/putative methionine-R-sulfoxide reductase with GAF domain
VIADNRAELVQTQIEKYVSYIRLVQQSKELENALQNMDVPENEGLDLFDLMGGAPEEDSTSLIEESDPLTDHLSHLKSLFKFESLTLTTPDGLISASTVGDYQSGQNFPDPDGTFIDRAAHDLHFSTVKKEGDDYFAFLGAPAHSHIVIAKVDLKSLFSLLSNTRGLGETGEVALARIDPGTKKIIFINPLRNTPGNAQRLINLKSKAAQPIRLALANKSGSGISTDYLDREVLAAWRKIDFVDWVLLAKIDTAEINGVGATMIKTYGWVGATIITLALALSMMFSSTLTYPLNSMRNTLDMVSKGILPERTNHRTNDEFGLMATKVDSLVSVLKSNAEFAQKVGEGKFDAAFVPASEDDALGQALINMRNNLIENEQRDSERNWIVRGVAEVGEILRTHDSLSELGDDVIHFIIGKIGAIQASFYVVNDDSGERLIEMKATYAYNRKKYLNKTFRFAEGLVGQAAVEKDTVMRTEIPDDYVTITSGLLGDQKPKCILVVPLITNEEVYGVLEFAGFKRFDPSQVKFVQELSLILARTVFNIKVSRKF